MSKAYGPKKKGPGGRVSKASSKQGGSTPRTNDMEYVTRRMLSARRIKINELRNETEDLKTTVVELQQENKMIKRTNALHEKALGKYENQESDMPQVIQRHNEEVRMLRDQLRKHKEKFNYTDRNLHDKDRELAKAKKQLKKLQQIAEDKELGERDELAKKLSKAEIDVEDREKRVQVGF